MKDKPKIALLKQEVYQDLYVCPVTEKTRKRFSSLPWGV